MRGPSEFGECLRAFRIGKGMSQQMLAERANISVAAVCALERGRRKAPYRETLALISSALQLDGSGREKLAEAALASRPRRLRLVPGASEWSAGAQNFPWHLTSFHGRERELAVLAGAMREQRLVTLCGPAGAGKSRLAVALAVQTSEEFAHGMRHADLAACGETRGVAAVLGAAVGIVATGEEAAALRRIAERIGEARMLIVLDNAERQVDAAARAASFLLARCRSLTMLPTTREPLRVGGEYAFRLGGLRPEDGRELLFARAALEPAEPAAAAHASLVCERVDGLPLAIEIAAARLRTIGLRELAEGLADPVKLLNSGPSLRASYQETLAASIERSFESLTAEDRRLFFTLTRFGGEFRLDDAAAACGGDRWDVIDALSSLVEKSLVETDEHRTTYRLLNTVRAYGSHVASREQQQSERQDDSP